jgi:hypothetical protein
MFFSIATACTQTQMSQTRATIWQKQVYNDVHGGQDALPDKSNSG